MPELKDEPLSPAMLTLTLKIAHKLFEAGEVGDISFYADEFVAVDDEALDFLGKLLHFSPLPQRPDAS
jgi:hypothetical protein